MTNAVEYLFICLLAIYTFVRCSPCLLLCSFFYWIVCLFLTDFQEFFILPRYESLVKEMDEENLPLYGLFFTLLLVPFVEKKYLVLICSNFFYSF